jgi:hypothetical protein
VAFNRKARCVIPIGTKRPLQLTGYYRLNAQHGGRTLETTTTAGTANGADGVERA